MFFSKAKGILGMNARNLLYIARYNSSANKRFADDKIYTKNFLSSRGIGAAKMYTVIKSHRELKRFQPESLPLSFVVKPNHGFGGEGIIVITGRENSIFITARGRKLPWIELRRNMAAILDGKYAISGLRDEVIIEERLLPHEYFRPYCQIGLPDVRIIVFNLVPVVAMLRVPTPESEGKANLHLGAIGLGIDLGTGRATYGVQHGKFIKRLPSGDRISSLLLPEWDEVMLTAAQCQKVSGVGYLAADLAITTKGIKVLELNARAGLSVQIANRVYLRSRLEKVADIKVLTPEKGVEVARTLFAGETQRGRQDDEARVIGAYETVRIAGALPEHVVAKIDPHAEYALLDEGIEMHDESQALTLYLREEKLVIPFRRAPHAATPYQLVLPGKYLHGYLIDVARGVPSLVQTDARGDRDEKILANIDKKLADLSASIHFLSYINPQNLDEIKKLFLENPSHAPEFFYKPLDLDIPGMRKEIARLPRDFSHPLRALYVEKMDELHCRLDVIEHRGTPDLMKHSIALYGDVSREEFDAACAHVRAAALQEDTGEWWEVKRVKKELAAYLARIPLAGWNVAVKKNAVADMQVVKSGSILVNHRIRVTENRFKSQMAHEIETHVFREENGKIQPYRIFEQGTARYLETEEGLAVFNQNMLGLPLGEKIFWAAWRVIAIWHGRTMGFVELYHFLMKEYGLSTESAWHTCVKAKRGLSDTSAPAVFTKDHVYFSGWNKVQEFYRTHGVEGMRKLYRGKIKIEDLPLMDALEGVEWKVRYVPAWMNSESPKSP